MVRIAGLELNVEKEGDKRYLSIELNGEKRKISENDFRKKGLFYEFLGHNYEMARMKN